MRFDVTLLLFGAFCAVVISGLAGIREVFGTPGLYATAVGVGVVIVLQARKVFSGDEGRKLALPLVVGVLGFGFLPPAIILWVGLKTGAAAGSFGGLAMLMALWWPLLLVMSTWLPTFRQRRVPRK